MYNAGNIDSDVTVRAGYHKQSLPFSDIASISEMWISNVTISPLKAQRE